MPAPRLGIYSDIQPIFDLALTHGGGSVPFDTHGKAVNWRHRAYRFRKAYASTVAKSPYDSLTMPKLAPNDTVVIIKIIEPATFIPANPTSVGMSDIDDDMLADAEALFRKINGGE